MFFQKIIFNLLVSFKLLFLSSLLFTTLNGNEKVSLQLKWFHQFQFAGYYAAKEKGFYDEVGLDVEIKQRDLRYNNIEQVINNESEYGIADSVLVLYKARQLPVVIVSPIFQHAPSALLSLKDGGINSPYDLNGKNVIFYPNDTDAFSLLAMMKKLDVKPNLIREREKGDFTKLINKEVDVMASYLSNEPYYFKERNIPINIINPTSYGFDLYGDMLFTNSEEVKKHPLRVKRFKDATLKGWRYALENKEEIIQLIHNKYNPSKSIEHLRYEANVIDRLISQEITPLGTLDKGRVKYISSLYSDYDTEIKSFDIKEFIFEEYVHNESQIDLTDTEKNYLKNNPILKVHNFLSFPPFNFYENGRAKGYSIDYMNLIAKSLGIKIEYIHDKSWKESLDMIKSNELNILPNVAINNERKKFIDYSSFAHVYYNVALATKKDSDVKSFDDIKNKTLAVLNKSFIHTIIKKNYPNQKLYLASTIKDAILSVSNGKSDVVIDSMATLEYYISHNWLSNLRTIKLENIENIPTSTPLYMGVSKGNQTLLSILEKAYVSIPYNEVVKLNEKWLNTDSSFRIELSNKEYDYLQNKKELNLCIDPNWMPFEKIENGKHIGMTSEYIKIFNKALPIPIKLYSTEDWLDTVTKAEEKKCDIVSLMLETTKRKKYLNFTKPLMEMPVVISTKINKPFINNLENLLDEKFAVVEGFAYKSLLLKKYPKIKIIEVSSVNDGLQKVDDNEVYGFIGTLPVIGHHIQENFVGNLKINGKLNEKIAFPMASRNDEPHLNNILNKLISSITDDENREISNKWLSIQYDEAVDYTVILYMILVFIVILAIIMVKNNAINKINGKLSSYIDVIDTHVLTSTTDRKGIITSASQALCDISGYSKDELIGLNHRILRHEDMSKELFETMWNTILDGDVWEGEIKNKKNNGQYYWVSAMVSPNFDNKGKIVGFTSIRHDITDKKKVEEISITDELTTLYNKRYFNQIFNQELNRAKRENHYFSLIILDVDFFKQYNDFYGHQKGDYVLESIGTELKKLCKRSSDIPFRIGGEEFGIIFTPHSIEESIAFARMINKAIESLRIKHSKSNVSKFITASIGLYTEKGKSLESVKEIYHNTDTALYYSKSSGRNRYTLYSKDIKVINESDIYYI